jgi:hypothetical protein
MSVTAALLFLAGAAQPATLSDIRLHLFYEGTGRLSPDLTQNPDFAGWNVVIGKGSAEEPANDLLVVAELRSSGEQFVETPLKIVVTDGTGKNLASREFPALLIPAGGRVYMPVWLANAGCAGEIKVNAQFGEQRRSEVLELHCGE